MIILDTNILSELMKPQTNPHVKSWLDIQNDVFITSISVAEIWFGIDLLHHGKRRNNLLEEFGLMPNEI